MTSSFRISFKALWRNRWFAYGVRAPLLAYCATTAMLYYGQDWLLYAGAGGRSEMPAHDELPVALTDAQGAPVAWVAEPAGDKPLATVVFFHGNFSLAQHVYEARWEFLERGMRVVFVEYPGYGYRKAGDAKATTVIPDMAKQIKAAKQKYPDEPLWVFGESLGAGVAAQAIAKADMPVDRVMLAVPWHTLEAVAAKRYPWVSTSRLVKENYDTCLALKPLADKVWLVGAENDRVIPVQHAKSLAHCLQLPADRLRVLPKTGHNDWYFGLGQQRDGWNWLLGGTRSSM